VKEYQKLKDWFGVLDKNEKEIWERFGARKWKCVKEIMEEEGCGVEKKKDKVKDLNIG